MSYPVIFPEAPPDGAPESPESMLGRARELRLPGLEALAEAFKAAEAEGDPGAWLYREEMRLRLMYAELLGELPEAEKARDKAALASGRAALRTLRRTEGEAVARMGGRELALALRLRAGRPEGMDPAYPKGKADKTERMAPAPRSAEDGQGRTCRMAQKRRRAPGGPRAPLLPGVAEGRGAERGNSPDPGPREAFNLFLENFRRLAEGSGVPEAGAMAEEALRLFDSGESGPAAAYQCELSVRGLLARLKNTLDFSRAADFAKAPERAREAMLALLEDDERRIEGYAEDFPEAYGPARRLKAERPAWLDPDAPPRPEAVAMANMGRPVSGAPAPAKGRRKAKPAKGHAASPDAGRKRI